MAPVPRVKLGSQGLEVSKQGLGLMGLSDFYGTPKPEPEAIELIHHAVNSGITFLDTSDFYGPFTNEILLGKALKGIRDKVQVATKFSLAVDPATGATSVHGEPEYVRAALEASLKRLDVDYVDLYYQHRPDPKTPIEIRVGWKVGAGICYSLRERGYFGTNFRTSFGTVRASCNGAEADCIN